MACCVDAQKQVMDCYKNNGQRSLNCSKEVESFVRCVAAFRSVSVLLSCVIEARKHVVEFALICFEEEIDSCY